MHRHALILILLLCACGDDDDGSSPGRRDAGPDGGRPPGGARDGGRDAAGAGRATSLALEGTAAGSADEDAGGGDRVECRFFGTIDQIEYEADGDFTGIVSGELFRTTYIDDGVFEFIPLIGGPASLTHTGATAVELRFVGDQPPDAIEFWQELEVVTGRDLGDDRYAGDWQCAPGLLGGSGAAIDIDLTVPGEWTLEPAP